MSNSNSTSTSIKQPTGKGGWNSVKIFWNNQDDNDFTHKASLPKLHEPDLDDFKKMGSEIFVSPFEPDHLKDDTTETLRQAMLEQSKALEEEEKEDFMKKFFPNKFNSYMYDDLFFFDSSKKEPEKYEQLGAPWAHVEAEKEENREERLVVGKIVNAVQQWIIVEISSSTFIGSTIYPNVDVWAFLQPATIGGNKSRRAINNGFVVDDAPRSGWFEAKILGNNGSPAIKADPFISGGVVDSKLKVMLDESDRDKGIIRYKLNAIVKNRYTKKEFKELVAARNESSIAAGKEYLDHFECGCWLKVWARNPDIPWEMNPEDNDAVGIVDSMNSQDAIKGVPGTKTYNPQLAPNHSWRRARLTDYKIEKGDDGEKKRKNLLYVGLYPKDMIEALENMDKELQKLTKETEKEHSVNPAIWFGTSIVWVIINRFAQAYSEHLIKNYKQKPGKVKSDSEIAKECSDQVIDLMKFLKASEVFTSFAIWGFNEFGDEKSKKLPKEGEAPKKWDEKEVLKQAQNLSKKFFDTMDNAQKKHPKTYGFTKFLYDQITDLMLCQTPAHYIEHLKTRKEEAQEFQDLMEGKKKPFWKKPDRDSAGKMARGVFASFTQSVMKAEKVTKIPITFPLIEGEKIKQFPAPIGRPLPIPYMQWLIYAVILKLKAKIEAFVEFELTWKDAKTAKEQKALLDKAKNAGGAELSLFEKHLDKMKMSFGLRGNEAEGLSEFSVTLDLHAAWGKLSSMPGAKGSAYKKKNGKDVLPDAMKHGIEDDKTNFQMGNIIKEVFSWIDVHVYIGAALKLDAVAGVEFEMDYTKTDPKEKSRWGFDPSLLKLSFNAPAFAQISILSWQTSVANANLVEVDKGTAVLLREAKFLGNTLNVPSYYFRFGEGRFTINSYLWQTPTAGIKWGDSIQWYAGYTELSNCKGTGLIYGTENGETTKDALVKNISCVDEKNIDTDTYDEFKNWLRSEFTLSQGSQYVREVQKDSETGKDLDLGKLLEYCSKGRSKDAQGEYSKINLWINPDDKAPERKLEADLKLYFPELVNCKLNTSRTKSSMIYWDVTVKNFNDTKIFIRLREDDTFVLRGDDPIKYRQMDGKEEKAKEWIAQEIVLNTQNQFTIGFDINKMHNLKAHSEAENEWGTNDLEVFPQFALKDGEEYLFVGCHKEDDGDGDKTERFIISEKIALAHK
ncbi:MAG: hypothetical protein OCC49_00120 [Fibrobacterales bacterium]